VESPVHHATACRACRGPAGELVLDLGRQPACDYFPAVSAPGPDPVYPLAMSVCSACGLAQLVEDPTLPEETKGVEPQALILQAAAAVSRVDNAGLIPRGGMVAEYGSPHGGSWLGILADRGMVPVAGTSRADLIIDCFGMMHSADQAAALDERAARLAPGGTLLLQYHSLETIVRYRQWNALRHGHFAYYSTTALVAMLSAVGFHARTAWKFDLYGGTVLLAAQRDADEPNPGDEAVNALLATEKRAGTTDPGVLAGLQDAARGHARALREWLEEALAAGQAVLGYGAASRAVALLNIAAVDSDLLPAVADASPAKQGSRMPGTSIPVVSPDELIARRPDAVLLFVPDLLAEVQASYPEIEAAGGRWVTADRLTGWHRRK
jgi:C-methyltransferase C-terminal domain/Putative zinc binding domain/Methyltransferase domain